jgi:hypothetical protein
MATDMGEHMAIVSKLKTEIQKRLENPDDEIGDEPQESLRILVMQVVPPCLCRGVVCVCGQMALLSATFTSSAKAVGRGREVARTEDT